MLKDLLKHMEIYHLSGTVYFLVEDIYGRNEYTVTWDNEHFPKEENWKIRKNGENIQRLYSKETLPAGLGELNIDLFEFEVKILNNVLSHVTHAHNLIKNAKEVIGKEVVEESIQEYERFFKELSDIIKDVMTQDKEESEETNEVKLSVIDGDNHNG